MMAVRLHTILGLLKQTASLVDHPNSIHVVIEGCDDELLQAVSEFGDRKTIRVDYGSMESVRVKIGEGSSVSFDGPFRRVTT